MASIFFGSYMGIVFFVLTNMFIGIVTRHFDEVHEQVSNADRWKQSAMTWEAVQTQRAARYVVFGRAGTCRHATLMCASLWLCVAVCGCVWLLVRVHVHVPVPMCVAVWYALKKQQVAKVVCMPQAQGTARPEEAPPQQPAPQPQRWFPRC